ncbi:HAD-IA family hydrolase [Streptomyces sp. TR06-5]|uniref:HAD-IA family hydrolase n=1 Tax=unclassified Streptomyces TaxID=2593676 RepID=UPI0039A114A2
MTTTDRAPAGELPFDAVLCDIDNVIRFYDHTELTRRETAAGLPAGTTARVAFSEGVDPGLLTGLKSRREWLDDVRRDLCARMPEETARHLTEAFASSPTRADEDVLELLLAAQRCVPVVLVTNASTDLDAELEPLGFAEHFAGRIVNSARVGVAKPDPEIYTLAAGVAGVAADRCLFVDDRRENVDAAVALGMTGVHYRVPDDLRTALTPVLDPVRR